MLSNRENAKGFSFCFILIAVELHRHEQEYWNLHRYQIKNQKDDRSLAFELALAVVASTFMGFGTFFLMLWAGFVI
jgi:hypothetical protein